MRKTKIFLALAALLFAACSQPAEKDAETSTFDLAKETEWIRNELEKFRQDVKKGDTIAVASYYSSDAIAYPPDMEPVIKKDLAAFWGQGIRMGVKDIQLNVTEVLGDEDMLIEIGTYEMFGDNNVVLEKGNYLSVLKKENGTWKVHRDIWNRNSPLPSTN